MPDWEPSMETKFSQIKYFRPESKTDRLFYFLSKILGVLVDDLYGQNF